MAALGAVAAAAPHMPETVVEQAPPLDPLERIKSDFRVFLFVVWDHLGLPEPTPVQYDIAYSLQHGPRRQIIEAFRGVGKSWITAAFVLWLLLNDPDLKIMVVSASKVRADDFSTFCLRLIREMPMLAHLAPHGDQKDSKIAFDVGPSRTSKDPSVKSVGITGQITGSRADVIIPDDVEVPGNSMTQGQRDKLAELVKEFDAVLKPGGRIIYLGTPQTEQSLYLTLAQRGYEVAIWPARFPDPKHITGVYGAALAPFIKRQMEADPALIGKTVEPRRFTDTDLLEREASYGRAGFALQFMLDTRLSDADRYPLKLSDLLVMNLDRQLAPIKVAWGASPECLIHDLPNVGLNGDRWYRPIFTDKEWAQYTGCVMAIDPSGRGKDETAYAIVKYLHGFLFLAEVGGFRSGYEDDTMKALAEAAKRHAVKEIVIESNFGDGMFARLLTPWLGRIYPCTIEEVRSVGQKELRIIDTLEPVMMQHRLVIAEEVARSDRLDRYQDLSPEQSMRYALFYQMTRITRDRGALMQDDRLESVAMAVGRWVEFMARDSDKAVEEHREQALKDALEHFMDHALGRDTGPGDNWLDGMG